MFVALRDIRFAKGRFALMGSVVALITLLIVLLSGLTAGLADQSTSAVRNLEAENVAFGTSGDGDVEESYADSTVTAGQLDTWSDAAEWAEPVGITQTRAEAADGNSTAVALFGVVPDGRLAPDGMPSGDHLAVSEEIAETFGLEEGQALTISGQDLEVAAVVPDEFYSHTPAVWTDVETWRGIDPAVRHAEGADAPVANVVAAGPADEGAVEAADADAGTVSSPLDDSMHAVGSFSSENSSLVAMQGFLYVISAMVVGAFLTVWTIQRSGDVAILKALGGSTNYLLRDALAQALIVLVAGTALGGAVGVGVGALAAGVLPFSLTAGTTVGPVLALIVLGMLGAALAVRRITSVDPLTALGGVR
ncbi:ABC transporter permease [Nocardiopsis sp. HNM0947]|uniref:ABC transporter permease n=1 Tax=Nocardiopsis coralli TaxID=2772213 RepID=A0ABR9PAN6_9ACTN|nr:ABC transporter permease [Nocardiopsis coralli]MBE3000887.1 ABC transporter permease [Nocardiopsis coralli]